MMSRTLTIAFTAATMAYSNVPAAHASLVTRQGSSTEQGYANPSGLATEEEWDAVGTIFLDNVSSLESAELPDDLCALRSHERQWQEFLNTLYVAHDINQTQLTVARKLWRAITSLYGAFSPLSITQPTADSALQMAWNADDEYLDIEIMPNGELSWFYRNRQRNLVAGTGDQQLHLKKLSPRFFAYLKRFVRTAS